jgi:predicted lipid-binding transport protein (Tim44 family)
LSYSKTAVSPGRANQLPAGKTAWSGGAMAGIIIGTLIIPLIGLIFTIYGFTQAPKRRQAWALLVITILSWIVNIIILSRVLG